MSSFRRWTVPSSQVKGGEVDRLDLEDVLAVPVGVVLGEERRSLAGEIVGRKAGPALARLAVEARPRRV
jgi:hypothetical protein